MVVTLWRDQDPDSEDDQRDPKSDQIWVEMGKMGPLGVLETYEVLL